MYNSSSHVEYFDSTKTPTEPGKFPIMYTIKGHLVSDVYNHINFYIILKLRTKFLFNLLLIEISILH